MKEDNKAIFRRYVDEVLNPGNYDRVEEFVAPEWQNHRWDLDGKPEALGRPGPEGYRQANLRSRAAFPDLHIAIPQMIAEGDWLAINTIWSGTHEGVWRGIAPTGNRVIWGEMFFRRFANGKMVEGWVTSAVDQQLKALGIDLSRYDR